MVLGNSNIHVNNIEKKTEIININQKKNNISQHQSKIEIQYQYQVQLNYQNHLIQFAQ